MGGRNSGGHNRKSAARKKLEGNAGKRNSKRARKAKRAQPAIVYSGPLGAPPEKMGRAHKTIWAELSAIVPAGIVEKSDRWMFEVLVCLMARFRVHVAKAGEVTQMLSLLAKLGMTPADRDRVKPSQPSPPKNDPFADFAPARPQ